MSTKNPNSHCQGRTKSGNPCRAAATAGGLCFFHTNPNKASELGRVGGQRKRHLAAENGDPLPTLDNATAVRDTVARLIEDLYSGKVHPRIAAGLAPLLHLQLRAIESIENADLARRLAIVEKMLAQTQRKDTFR